MILQFVDRMFLAWHSPQSVAGAGTAGMLAFCLVGFFSVTTGFTNVFAAQYIGARRPERLGPAIWQGWYLSLLFGIVTFVLAFWAVPLFEWMGHGPEVQKAEIEYFQAYMKGGLCFMVTNALLGFFIGRGDNRVVMAVQIAAIIANILLDYGLIFGKLGLPNWGVAGAAWATIISQLLGFVIALFLFWTQKHRRLYATWGGWRLEPALCLRILKYGSPSGLRFIIELIMWSIFLGLIGQIGDVELAVSNVAFTINSLAWQPMLGVSLAVSMLVGKAQGAGRPALSRLAMRRGFIVTQAWQMAAALAFILFPDFFLNIFFGELSAEQAQQYLALGRALLWFVAAYCLIDAVNVVFAQGLIGAGDSWWISKTTLLMSIATIGIYLAMSRYSASLYAFWLVATLCVGISGLAWLWHYRGKGWESMQVVETVVVEKE